MTPVQWLFHYLEICKHQKRDLEIEIKKLQAGSSEIKKALKYLMIVVDQDRGKKAVEIIEEEDEKFAKMQNGEIKEDNNSSEVQDNSDSPLSKENQELWDFMMSAPETMKLPEKARMTRDYVVEAKSLADVAEDLGLIGMTDVAEDLGSIGMANDIKEFDDCKDDKSNEENSEEHDNNSQRKPMIVKSIGSADDENISLGFDME